jgi:hypothetical protein
MRGMECNGGVVKLTSDRMFKRNEMEIGYWNWVGRWMTESGDSKRPDFGFIIGEGKIASNPHSNCFCINRGRVKMYERTNKRKSKRMERFAHYEKIEKIPLYKKRGLFCVE